MDKTHRSGPAKDFWAKADFSIKISRQANTHILNYLDEVLGGIERVGRDVARLNNEDAWKDELHYHHESVALIDIKLESKLSQLEIIQSISKQLTKTIGELESEKKAHVLAADSLVQQYGAQRITLPLELIAKTFDILYEDERKPYLVQPMGSALRDPIGFVGTTTPIMRYQKSTISSLIESHLFPDEWKSVVLRCAPLILTDVHHSRLFHDQYAKGSFQYIQLPELKSYPRYHSLQRLPVHDLSWHLRDVNTVFIILDGLRDWTEELLTRVLALRNVQFHLHIITRGDNKSTKDFNPIPRFILDKLSNKLQFIHILDVPPALSSSDTTVRSYPDSYDWAPFENKSVIHASTKVARLPVPFIKGLAPVLSSLRRLTLWIPGHIGDVGVILSALRCLPRGLNELCIFETRKDGRQFSGMEGELERIEFPELKELTFIDFDAIMEVSEAISRSLDCPLLKAIGFNTWSHIAEVYYNPNLLNWIDAQHPRINRLSLICEVRQKREAENELFAALSNSSLEGTWLLPHLNELEISIQREEDLDSLETLAMARFMSSNTSCLNAIIVRTTRIREEGENINNGFIEDGLMESCLSRVRKIVPNVIVKELDRSFEVDG
ncbi:hypothetical protein SCHPADRAFT_1002168 [Schizopora paradoxa]|uniref:Uncharacterized protein n=1 Tax=Schizopora paradoxa TaxID=27342 RepID=A0A0H2R4G5_9AGAM|nr:hypothetical protein SCHPADRAFT_1002168 [Schizopora paradoxa]